MVRLEFRRFLTRCALAMSLMASALPAMSAEIECQYHTDLEYLMNMPIYHWAPSGPAKGVVLALHGLVMHGQAYDELGKSLAEKGFLVYSTDMRGYGRLTKEYPHEFCSAKDCKQKIHYGKSAEDLVKLADKLKQDHPELPLYVIGESMGADMAIRIASARPNLADGLVLSAPAIRAHHFVDSNTVKNLPVIMANFRKQLDLMPYVKKYASEDPKVVHELSKDPMLRRKMSTYDLLMSRMTINDTLNYVPNISPNKPVLVLQAKDDRCVRADAVVLLMSRLKSQDQQVRWFESRGHILIETAHIRPDTMETITSWLDNHNLPKTALQTQSGEELLTSDTEGKDSPKSD